MGAVQTGRDDRYLDPRVTLAAQRTLLAWIRTGLAMMGFGFVVARFGLFLREIAASRGAVPPRPGSASQWVGIALVLLGVLVNVLAAAQHVRFIRGYNRGEPLRAAPFSLGVFLSGVLAGFGVLLAGYLLVLR